MLRIRTSKDNRQLGDNETQFESTHGAVSAYVGAPEFTGDKTPCVTLWTTRGLRSRKAQFATLDAEALDAFIEHLQGLRETLP